jgi:hypothetical protein
MIPELPLTLVQSLERRLVAATSLATSPFTGSAQLQDWGGEWWEYQIEMAQMQGRDGRRLAAFFAQLGGARGRFLFRDPAIVQNPGGGDPVIDGAGQSGNLLATRGWVPDAPALLAGDFLSLGAESATRLYQVTEDATLSIVPRLRAFPADAAPLEVTTPAVLLRLAAPVPARIGRADSYRFSFTAREAL